VLLRVQDEHYAISMCIYFLFLALCSTLLSITICIQLSSSSIIISIVIILIHLSTSFMIIIIIYLSTSALSSLIIFCRDPLHLSSSWNPGNFLSTTHYLIGRYAYENSKISWRKEQSYWTSSSSSSMFSLHLNFRPQTYVWLNLHYFLDQLPII